MSDCELTPVAWMPAGVKPQEFLKPICTVTFKEQGVLEVLSSKCEAWLLKARTGLYNGHGQIWWSGPSELHPLCSTSLL